MVQHGEESQTPRIPSRDRQPTRYGLIPHESMECRPGFCAVRSAGQGRTNDASSSRIDPHSGLLDARRVLPLAGTTVSSAIRLRSRS